MTPTIVTIRAGVQFTPEAAAAFRRAEAQVQRELGRLIDVNSTYRDWDKQLSMYNAWQAYINGRGPYPGHSKALHPDSPLAFHVTGEALDSDDWVNERIVFILAVNGFIRNRLYVPNENHHFEYIRSRDKHYGKPAASGGGGSEDEMSAEAENQIKAVYAAIFGPANVDANELNWREVGGGTTRARYGVLPIVIHNQTLIAKNAGELAALKAAVSQLSAGSGVALDMKAIEAAAERGAKDALRDLTLTVDVDG